LVFGDIVSSCLGNETILRRDETIFRFGAELRKRRMVIKPTTRNGTQRDQPKRETAK
jgi:hypothetical protein